MDCEDILATLEFYANRENYMNNIETRDGYSISEMLLDGGEKARELLKKLYEEE